MAQTVAWKDLDQDILDAIENLDAKGFKEPTVRAVYYVLGSLGKIPLTKNGYKSLDKKIVEMRKNGKIDWGFFAVKRGTSIESDKYQSPKEQFRRALNYFTNLQDYFEIPRWHGQPKYVEVWIEKDGLLGALHNWTSDMGITVRAPQGYGAWEFINDSIHKIERVLETRREACPDEDIDVHILYLGDLDPSGKDIPRFIEDGAFDHFGFNVTFTEIALTLDQVSEHQLPEIPDSQEVREKIERDPRYRKYVEEYGKVFCELDAFFSLKTEEARELIRDKVNELYDESYEDARDELEKDGKSKIRKMVKDAIKAAKKDDNGEE